MFNRLDNLMQNKDIRFDLTDFDRAKLVKGKQPIITHDSNGDRKVISVNGYQLPGYDAFSLRKYMAESWVLSIRGKLITYGSYSHVIDVIMLIMQVFKCWNSDSSLAYFLSLTEYTEVIKEIVKLRHTDHNMKVQLNS